MGFLIRTTFWFSLVLLALPLGATDEQTGEPQVGALEAIIAAGEAMSDIAGMCERKPEVCETGKSALSTIGVRARDASRFAYETLDQRFGETDATMTGSVPVPRETVPAESQPAPAE